MHKARLFALIPLCLAASAPSAAPNMQAGLWEITTQANMPGMPAGMSMPAITLQHCFSEQDVQQSRALQPQQGDCRITDLQENGNQVSWTLECAGPQPMSVRGTGTFNGDSYQVSNSMNMHGGPSMTAEVQGRRIGACP